jgi:ABC-type Na+ efflux pump permease subunit
MEQSKLFSSGVGMEKLVYVMSGVSYTMLDAGEQEKSVGEEVVAMFVPMILILFIYIMNLVYGMSIGNIVSSEKTSKLMERILTLTKPYGLFFGKIFAMATIAILQMLLWIGCFVGGFIAGDFVAKEMIYPEYNNVILEVINLISNQDGSTAFTIGALILSIVTVCIGFLFYCVIAGTCASFATKAEDLAQAMSIYQLIMIGGFFCAYMLPMQEKAFINTILRIVPITSAYLLPGDLVVGNVSVGLGCLYFGILLLTTLVLLVVAGKVYKNQMFYRGQSILDRFKKKKKQK